MAQSVAPIQSPRSVRGKTKIIRPSLRDPRLASIESLDRVTWNNKHRAPMKGKGEWSNTTTCNMFELLRLNGIPVAYVKRTGRKRFQAFNCKMIKLEVIVRDVVDENSSYLTRNPDTVPGLRFPEPRVEFFLKTDTDEIGGIKLPDIDPFITRWDYTGVWVHHPKQPVTEEGETFVPASVLGWDRDGIWPFRQIATLSLRGFVAARKAWGRLGFDLRDWKGEFGTDLSGRLLWADVLDNDSWRMFGPDGKEYSKQNIRLGKSIEEAANDYRYIAEKSDMMLRLARAA